MRSGIISSVSAASSAGITLGGHRSQLEDGVDRHELDPGALVELTGRHIGEHALHRSGPAPVAVVDGVLHETPPGVDQREVDAP